jgi:hypothetical protein
MGLGKGEGGDTSSLVLFVFVLLIYNQVAVAVEGTLSGQPESSMRCACFFFSWWAGDDAGTLVCRCAGQH